MIGLVDLLVASGQTVSTGRQKLKVHLASWNGSQHPIDVYYAGNFNEWQQWQTRRNFECSQVLSLIDLGQGNWLFAGLYEVGGSKPHPENPDHRLYSLSLVAGQTDMVGRIVVRHQRTRASYVWYKPKADSHGLDLPVVQILKLKMTVEEFPGYNAVLISHDTLTTITKQRIASWYGALANIKGVYLITDTSTGRHYVGKASGDDGIWQRWCDYAKNGHGGNKLLQTLIKAEGIEYARNFQYSVLEIADSHASDQAILSRESHWMSVLKTREFGLN